MRDRNLIGLLVTEFADPRDLSNFGGDSKIRYHWRRLKSGEPGGINDSFTAIGGAQKFTLCRSYDGAQSLCPQKDAIFQVTYYHQAARGPLTERAHVDVETFGDLNETATAMLARTREIIGESLGDLLVP